MNDMSGKPQFGESDEHLPPWLQGLPLPARPPSRESSAIDAGARQGQSGTMPAFTPTPDISAHSQQPELGPTGDADAALPDWLRDLESEVGDLEDEVLPMDDQPDWLASLSADESTSATTPDISSDWSESTEAADVPDWLQAAAESAVSDPPTEPDPFQSSEALPETSPPEVSTETSSRVQMPIGATDWLRSLGEDVEQEALAEIAEEPSTAAKIDEDESSVDDNQALPSWLRDVSPDELARDMATADAQSAEPSSSEWSLQSDQPSNWFDDDVAAADTPQPDLGMADDTPQAPDWLAGIPGQEEHADITEDTHTSESSADDVTFSDTDEAIPDWLRGEISTASASAETTPAGDLPAWLSDIPVDEQPPSEQDDITQVTPLTDDSSAELPSWLSGGTDPSMPPTSSQDDVTQVASGMSDASELPPWLAGDAGTSVPTPSQDDITQVAPLSSDAEGLPSWLAEDTEPTSPESREALPAWLGGDDGETASPPHSDVVESESLPSWLTADSEPPAELSPPAVDRIGADWPDRAEDDISTTQPQPEDDDIPDWLRAESQPPILPQPDEALTSDPTTPDPPPWMVGNDDDALAPPSASTDASLPVWLRGVEGDIELPAAQPDTPASEPFSADAAEDIPDWLQSDADNDNPSWLTTEMPTETSTWFDAGPGEADPRDDIPGWLRDEKADSAPESTESSEFFGATDLPDWLHPSQSETPKSPESTQIDWLSRLGAQEDDSDIAPAAETAQTPLLPRPVYTPSAKRLEAAALFQRLVAEPFPDTPIDMTPAKPSIWQRVGIDRILYMLFLAAIVASLLVPSFSNFVQMSGPIQIGPGGVAAGSPVALEETINHSFSGFTRINDPVQVSPSAVDGGGVFALEEAINQLSAEDVVLVAYEWDAQRIGEMAPLEQAVTQHLIDQGVHLVIVSTDPQGTLLSFDLRDPLQEAGYEGRGFDYVLLGYRPGGDLALRSMAQDFRATLRSDFNGQDATVSGVAMNVSTGAPRLTTLEDLKMIIVMADQPQDVQSWMEQIHTSAESIPIAFLLPMEVAPVVQPYLRRPNVLHLIGKQDALNYRLLRGDDQGDQSAVQESGQQQFAVVTFIALIVLGWIVGMVLQAVQRKER